jgi:hypothetical protein
MADDEVVSDEPQTDAEQVLTAERFVWTGDQITITPPPEGVPDVETSAAVG